MSICFGRDSLCLLLVRLYKYIISDCWLLPMVMGIHSLYKYALLAILIFNLDTKCLSWKMEWHSNSITLAAFLLLSALFMEVLLVSADFSTLFKPNWAPDHILTQGDQILLTLDNTTGNTITWILDFRQLKLSSLFGQTYRNKLHLYIQKLQLYNNGHLICNSLLYQCNSFS